MRADLDEFHAKLEAAGEDAVRIKFAQRAYGIDNRPIVEEWLRGKAAARAADAAARAERRDESKVGLAKDANVIAEGAAKTARDAFRMSVLSIGVALVAALIAALAYLAPKA